MREFCVAAAATIPVLLLTIAVEVRHLATKRLRFQTMTEAAYERKAYVASDTRRGRRRLLALLFTGGIGFFTALFLIPFSPNGYPTQLWHWVIILIVGLTTALVFVYAALVLLRAYEAISYEF
jgi:hypothetical protein